jgi:hypothetical protein
MSKYLFILLAVVLVSGNSIQEKENWISLFNGKNLDGWVAKFSGYQLGNNYKNTFRVEDGLLKISYDKYEKFNNEFGHLFFADRAFSNYKIKAEFRFTGEQVKDGPAWAFRNNGLMLHCQLPQTMRINQAFPVSMEVQLLGDDGSGNRPCANPCTPGTHFIKDDSLVTVHCPSISPRTIDGQKWNTIEVEVRADSLFRHILNGEVVAEYYNPQYDPGDEDAQKFISNGSLKLSEGYIAIQAETHPTEFRKIEVLLLD